MRVRQFQLKLDLTLKPNAILSEHKNKYLLTEKVDFRCLSECNKPPNPPAEVSTAGVTVTWTPVCHNKVLQLLRQIKPVCLQIVDI